MVELDSNKFNVNLNAFSGSLDVLLDLAKSQKVNLENISVSKLADQFHEFITKSKNLNLEIASDYLLMATWLTYLKSKLLLPDSDEEEFKALEVAEKLKLQLKKLELIRLLSDQMLKRKRLGRDVFMRGIKGKLKSIYNAKYSLTLYELLKSYSSIFMQKDFLTMNIPKLPSLTNSKDPEKTPAVPDLLKFLPEEKLSGIKSFIFFQSASFPKNSLILLIPSSVVNTGNLGIFIVKKSFNTIIDE